MSRFDLVVDTLIRIGWRIAWMGTVAAVAILLWKYVKP